MSEVLAVLLTWTAMSIGTILMGSPAGILARHRVGTLGALRVALWIGTATMTAVLLVANLFIPLGGIPAVEVVGLVMAAMVIGSAAMLVRQARSWARKPLDLLRRPAWWAMAAIAALALLLILFAGSVGGPVTNYDSGLYHLNAIQFSAGYPTIPGLANMQDRFGTNVSAFELAAFMTNSPWGAEAFRLLVGLFVTLFCVDTALRLIERRASARTAPGLFVMLLAFGLFGPFLLANADYWVTSPSPDTIAMLVTIVSGAYLVDAVRYRNGIWGTVALVMAVLAATVRTQLWLMAALTAVALAASWWLAGRAEHRSRGRLRLLTWLGLALSTVLLVAMLARDAVISGWLLYPASLLPLPVSWRAADPTVAADWVQSWARDPSSTPDQTLGNWGWLPEWAGRTLDDWSVRGSMALLALVLVVVLVARRPVIADGAATRPPLTPRFVGPWDVALVMLPCVGTVLAWFILAPDPRFAWGAIALLGLLPRRSLSPR